MIRKGINYWKRYGLKALVKTVIARFVRRFFRRRMDRSPLTAEEILLDRFIFLEPLRGFSVPLSKPRVNLVTDSINRGSLFGGVATALIFSSLLAKKWGCDLRIITRTDPARKQSFSHILEASEISFDRNVEFSFLDVQNLKSMVDVTEKDIFVTTSWWTTKSVSNGFGGNRIIYLLQEIEDNFYPYGDEHLRCLEVLRDPELNFVVNARLLYDHFISEGFNNIRDRGFWFEPAFSKRLFYYARQPENQKKNFFFYARPNNLRNLFYLGLEVINRAVSAGVLNLEEWEFFFVGKDIPKLKIGKSYTPQFIQNVSLAQYAEIARKMDLGLCLMYSSHPSYPPLDLAASGAVVVTNRFGQKQNLDNYSRNILCRDLNVGDLVQGIALGSNLALNYDERIKNYNENTICRDWNFVFETVFAGLEPFRKRTIQ